MKLDDILKFYLLIKKNYEFLKKYIQFKQYEKNLNNEKKRKCKK